MTELFWKKKGTMTGVVAIAASLAGIIMPLVTGLMAETGNISIIFIFDAVLSAIGFLAASIVFYRYGKVKNSGTAVEVLNKKIR